MCLSRPILSTVASILVFRVSKIIRKENNIIPNSLDIKFGANIKFKIDKGIDKE